MKGKTKAQRVQVVHSDISKLTFDQIMEQFATSEIGEVLRSKYTMEVEASEDDEECDFVRGD